MDKESLYEKIKNESVFRTSNIWQSQCDSYLGEHSAIALGLRRLFSLCQRDESVKPELTYEGFRNIYPGLFNYFIKNISEGLEKEILSFD